MICLLQSLNFISKPFNLVFEGLCEALLRLKFAFEAYRLSLSQLFISSECEGVGDRGLEIVVEFFVLDFELTIAVLDSLNVNI